MTTNDDWSLWDTKRYLENYFGSLGEDSFAAWSFLIRSLKQIKEPLKILDFGSGPTIFSIIPAAPYALEIHMCDYLDVNLTEIDDWLKSKKSAYDWRNCIKEVLLLEGVEASPQAIKVREDQIKSKIKNLRKCDASLEFPLGSEERFPLVISTYCIDSATSSKEIWYLYLKNLLSLVENDGILLLTALKNCKEYSVGDFTFPSANINEVDLRNALISLGISADNFQIETTNHIGRESDGIQDLMFASVKII